jgi:hypothetical protein
MGALSDVTSMSLEFRVFGTAEEHVGSMRSEFLHRHGPAPLSCPRCSACGGLSQRAVHTRTTAFGADTIVYLTEVWSCSDCGRQWEDEMLGQLNTRAAEAALAAWIAERAGGAAIERHGEQPPQPSFPKAHFANPAFR